MDRIKIYYKVIIILLLTFVVTSVLFLNGIPKTDNFKGKKKSTAHQVKSKIFYQMVAKNLTVTTWKEEAEQYKMRDYHHFYENKSLVLRCRECAVVSSSGYLLGKKAGAIIDQSTCIIRMNNAPTRGYEKDVGSRTDIRVMGYFNVLKHPGLKEATHDELLLDAKYFILHLGHTTGDVHKNPLLIELHRYLQFLSKWYRNDKSVQFYRFTEEKTMKSRILLSTFEKEMFNLDSSNRPIRWAPSTGWFTMLFALEVCDHITVYGMVPEEHCRQRSKDSTPYHYYGKTKLKECQYINRLEKSTGVAHRMSREKLIFANWASERGNMEFMFPFWNLSTMAVDNQNVTSLKNALASFLGVREK